MMRMQKYGHRPVTSRITNSSVFIVFSLFCDDTELCIEKNQKIFIIAFIIMKGDNSFYISDLM